jgi:hypothetical protein
MNIGLEICELYVKSPADIARKSTTSAAAITTQSVALSTLSDPNQDGVSSTGGVEERELVDA